MCLLGVITTDQIFDIFVVTAIIDFLIIGRNLLLDFFHIAHTHGSHGSLKTGKFLKFEKKLKTGKFLEFEKNNSRP